MPSASSRPRAGSPRGTSRCASAPRRPWRRRCAARLGLARRRGPRRRRRAAVRAPGRRGRRPRRGARRRTVRVSLTHSKGMAGAVAVAASDLPTWLEPLPDAELMRATDRWAIEECGIPSLELMERAGEGLARRDRPRGARRAAIAIVCGKGNNGGDGLVAARLLRARRARRRRARASGDPARASRRRRGAARSLAGPAAEPYAADAADAAPTGIVDALLGTGFTRRAARPRRAASSPTSSPRARR